ncbi:MAG: FAD-binding protein, partial [Bacteroidetes bacterium]
GFRDFGRKMRGFITGEALVAAVESRTSSPVRILRDPVTLTAEGIQGLYPAGEGAGYAGGIVSSAVDGMLLAQALIKRQ